MRDPLCDPFRDPTPRPPAPQGAKREVAAGAGRWKIGRGGNGSCRVCSRGPPRGEVGEKEEEEEEEEEEETVVVLLRGRGRLVLGVTRSMCLQNPGDGC